MQKMPEVKPEERNLSNQEAVAQLHEDITALRGKGYTWEAIAQFMSEQGVEIKAATLKSYARRAAAGSGKGRKARAKKASPAQVTVAEAAPTTQSPKREPKQSKPQPKSEEESKGEARFKPREDSDDI